MKSFNTTGICVAERNYMVDISERLQKLREMVDSGSYFTINRARQYGKTTTLAALEKLLESDYIVISMDFQAIGSDGFMSAGIFVKVFARLLIKMINDRVSDAPDEVKDSLNELRDRKREEITLDELTGVLTLWNRMSACPMVLIIDEVDSATNYQVFLDFLAQLRLMYLEQQKAEKQIAFRSVILAGVTDVRNLKRKLRPDEDHKINSPWNIATEFTLDMSLHPEGIAGMLSEYESDHQTGMDIESVARCIYDYTGGYPFLVSRICQIADAELGDDLRFKALSDRWTEAGVSEASRRLTLEQNTLFDSIMGKVQNDGKLKSTLYDILFSGDSIAYNAYDISLSDARMYGFIRIVNGKAEIACRIFETLLYDYFLLDSNMQSSPIYRNGSRDKNEFIKNGQLDMELVLSRYITAFDDVYGDLDETFDEDEGRRRFLLYLRPIINGTGNYYIEAETRNNRRMDVVVDYLGGRYVIELKIWRGDAYNERGEEQLSDYLSYYHLEKGYMLSYCFTKNKTPGIHSIDLNGRTLVEAIV